MNKYIIISQLISAGIGALGFSLVFNSGKRNLIPASLGGVLIWIIYLICSNYIDDFFVVSVITAAFCQTYSEVFARILKSPAIVFYIPSIIPLVPGSSLYYTMYYATVKDWDNFKYFGWITLQIALGIAVGTSFISAILLLFRKKTVKIQYK